MTGKRKRPIALLMVLAVIAATFYFCFIDRAWRHTERHGWVLDFSYVRLACPTCLGRIERLEYKGQPIKAPADSHLRISLLTPVVSVESWDEQGRWRYHGDERVAMVTGEPLSEETISEGFYTVDLSIRGGFPRRRPGTPESWCMLCRWDIAKGYWLAPEKYQQLLQMLLNDGPQETRQEQAERSTTGSAPAEN